MNKKLKEQVAGVFKVNPKIKELNVTSDGQCFEKASTAQSHQISLGKDTADIEVVGRNLESVEVVEETAANTEAVNAAVLKAVQDTKDAAKVELDEAVQKAQEACKVESDKAAAETRKAVEIEIAEAVKKAVAEATEPKGK